MTEHLGSRAPHVQRLKAFFYTCMCLMSNIHFLQALVENSSIQLLDLSGNQLSVETCLVLTEVMQVRRVVCRSKVEC